MENDNEQTALPYHPSHESHLLRVQNDGFEIDPDEKYLPEEFPKVIESPLVWKGEEVAATPERWILQLSKDDVDEIKGAMEVFLDTGALFKEISPATFSLSPELRERLAKLRDSLYDGLGFGLIKGLNSRDYTMKENIVIHAGLTSYFGSKRGYMGAQGNDVLAHIRNIQQHFPGQDIVSPSFTNAAMTFHTDLGDIVSIFTASKGTSGGAFRIASAWNVYNVLRATPYTPTIPSYQKPLLHFHAGRVLLQSFRRPFTGFGGTARNWALDTLHFAALNSSLTINFADGDLCVFNNLALLHARDQHESPSTSHSESHPESAPAPASVSVSAPESTFATTSASESGEASARHLLKMFVRDDDAERAWSIPPVVQDQWDELYGSRTDPRTEDFPFDYPRGGTVPNYGWSQNG
ncbi:hypothetical protein BZA05DRAFT_405421 [Tricharina praecox]|uniref:uncharacterized protein n=1 Tax=Tricharina praecox TaxID=43433 RepID=UPI002220C614|nr:uncharacterized protein BZA05DRAFT_405421 [Tricharina praecox]KAI5847615.1 hypothetical protein BZA05DRAFT_405421 [Tricharina praecox]